MSDEPFPVGTKCVITWAPLLPTDMVYWFPLGSVVTILDGEPKYGHELDRGHPGQDDALLQQPIGIAMDILVYHPIRWMRKLDGDGPEVVVESDSKTINLGSLIDE